jgi:acetoin utilization deacetylase AcuC-like enzyme
MPHKPAYWYSHSLCRQHSMGPGHPECPERLAAIEDRLIRSGLDAFVERREAPEASREALQRVHDAGHVQGVLNTRPASGLVRLDPDTAMNAHSADAALRAAGAVVAAVDAVIDGETDFAFCAVRPPGHHAERAQAMGFCLFNNVAVGAAHALARGLSRVAVFDFDVHYGNGTADIIRREPRVVMYSTYQYPLYPDWQSDPTVTNLVDVPLSPGSGSAEFREAVTKRWLPALEQFRPELILCSAGFDAHRADPLANLRLTEEDYRWIGEQTRDWSARWCQGRVVATLEGGYDLDALAKSVEAFVRPFVED